MKVPRSRRRGKSRIFRNNKFRAVADARLIRSQEVMNAKIIKLLHDVYRTAPLMEVKFENGETMYLPAFAGAYVGKIITYLSDKQPSNGDVRRLMDIPPGTEVYNVELKPLDGGKLVRAGGGFAKIVERTGNKVTLSMPSNSLITLSSECRAVVGRIANSGRKEKPFYKAGNKFHLIRARGRYWPMNAAVAMNAYEHKFGGKRRSSQHKNKSSSRNAPAGAKVGSIAPRRTGTR